jgi:TRAP-type mannitol/chloroaromatic compound transport system substrate-binding protein
MKYRTVGLSADVFKEMGAAVTILPGGEIVPAMDRGLLDAAEFNNPSSDILLGFPDVSKFYMMGSHHQQMESFEVIFNKAKFDALAPELKAILRNAAFAASSDQLYTAYDRYTKDFEAIKAKGVNIIKTGEKVLNDQLVAWDKVIAEQSKEPFFAKVIASQKAWVKRTGAYLQTNNLDSNAMATAYKRFFG